jgi:plastocyanin
MLSLLALGSACSKGPTDGGPEKPDNAKVFKPKGNEGIITGKIAYNGTAPAAKKIDTSADAVCASKNPNLETEENLVKDGKLANVFVYIKDGTLADGTKISDLSWETPTSEVSLDQSGCHYIPHVMGAQVKQKLKITNSDPTQHNIHFTPKVNVEWNQSQANGAPPMTHDFTRAEVVVQVKCNQHPWMKSYVGVLKHPYFAVSAADGSFTIKDVPPGTYTVIAWHEGGAEGTQQTKSVTVAAKGSTTADFAFGAASASGQKSSLEMMPAIEFPMISKP